MPLKSAPSSPAAIPLSQKAILPHIGGMQDDEMPPLTDPSAAPAVPRGASVIAGFVKNLPGSPGVYRMVNASGDVLYVGKAKNLKKRVTAYTVPEKNTLRIQRMIAMTTAMEFIRTETEAEALLLEANLIKQLKPRYNILLRDDKSFPYIRISAHDYPLVSKHRGAKNNDEEFFGPFASGLAVNETLAVLQRAFLLRNCSDNVFALRTRPCLQYQIKRCTAPCVNKVTREQYAEQVEMARQFLQGKSRSIQERFLQEMEAASAEMDYENAAFYRDRIRALTHIQSHQRVNVEGVESADVHALYQEGGQSCIQVFFFRSGQNFGNRAYFPRHERDETPDNILSAFIAQFYTNKPVPREIIVTHDVVASDIIEEALRLKTGHKVSILRPQRGTKKELVDMAADNAREALARRLAEAAMQSDLFEKLAETFGLNSVPERIEIYDNSHISGAHALGAMVVATPAGFQKNAYRRYNMPADKAGDDFGMMREMLGRRFQSLARDAASSDEKDSGNRPDLLLIDGGQGQLNAVTAIMADMGLSDIAVIAIAKGPDRNAGRERFFRAGHEPLSLPPNDPVLYFLQRLRDEAHRFAITSHRAKRGRAMANNPLDGVPGIGARRKKALLHHFGSAKAVAQAGVTDLQKVDGISRSVAEKIYAFFHSDDG